MIESGLAMSDASLFDEIKNRNQRGETVVLCTVIRARGSVPRHIGSKMLLFADGSISGTIGGGEMENRVIQSALALSHDGEGRVDSYKLADPASGDPGVCGGEVDIFVEPIRPEPTLLVIGAGHVGAALVHLGKWLGFHVILNDDREKFCNPESVPGADRYVVGGVEQLTADVVFHPQIYIVLATRGFPIDLPLLPELLNQPHGYLGVIGSRRRWATAVDELVNQGVSPAALAEIHAPMGLELNAETPKEIAMSILAEIIMLQRGGTGESMKLKADAMGLAAAE